MKLKLKNRILEEQLEMVDVCTLPCCSFAANAVRLHLHALAYNLANFMRTLALPEAVQWSLTSLRKKLVMIGAKVVRPPWPLRQIPVDRGRGAEGIVPGNLGG